ncbi:unnamed protein product [Urochloa decumbens]|uniref:F-box domain-containing protein n=1 Tax=Urochloa decumbens TaxID=240449 RepID=A0ABC9GDC1_9POAL
MEQGSDGEEAAGEDRLSALPDDVLVIILLRLRTPDAARTSLLARRWRRVWRLLPELTFPFFPEPRGFRDALDASAVPLRYLFVGGVHGASAASVADWLPAAARRVAGKLTVVDMGRGRSGNGYGGGVRGAIELPCFEKATSISLDLRSLSLSVPPAGVFTRLTELFLRGVRFHGPCELGKAVSSPRCPCLQKLTVQDARELHNLAIHSDSLKVVLLEELRGLRQLTVTAPVLEELSVVQCFFYDRTQQPVANISVPQLKSLRWVDAYDPSSVHLDKVDQLKSLRTIFLVYGLESFNRACLVLMSRFKVVESVTLALAYPLEINNGHYMMEELTILPEITSLYLILRAKGHSFGACSFHILRICPGIKRLIMDLSDRFILKAQAECAQDCICGQPPNWKTEVLMLNCLREVEIQEFRGSEHEVDFLKRLFSWATALKRMAVTFNRSVTESMVKELCQRLRTFSRPEICMEFYVYREMVKVLYASEG